MRRRMDKFLPLPGASLAAKVSILVNVSILVASRAEGNGEAGTQEEAKATPPRSEICSFTLHKLVTQSEICW